MEHSEEDLKQLSALLAGLPFCSDAMSLGELDGFLTGISLCPTTVPEKDRLPLFWGESDEGEPSTPMTSVALTLAIERHRLRIANSLSTAPDLFEAILQEDQQTGEVLWEDWIQGFEAGISLWNPDWRCVLHHEASSFAVALDMLASLYLVSIGESSLDAGYALDESEEIPDLVSALVRSIAQLTRSGKSAPRRNEPCICGSEHRYKHCCGAIWHGLPAQIQPAPSLAHAM